MKIPGWGDSSGADSSFSGKVPGPDRVLFCPDGSPVQVYLFSSQIFQNTRGGMTGRNQRRGHAGAGMRAGPREVDILIAMMAAAGSEVA